MSEGVELPMHTHAYVLGAAIGVAQRDCHRHEYQGHRTRETAVKVDAYEGRIHQQRSRKYLAAWARRTIERPAQPGDGR